MYTACVYIQATRVVYLLFIVLFFKSQRGKKEKGQKGGLRVFASEICFEFPCAGPCAHWNYTFQKPNLKVVSHLNNLKTHRADGWSHLSRPRRGPHPV